MCFNLLSIDVFQNRGIEIKKLKLAALEIELNHERFYMKCMSIVNCFMIYAQSIESDRLTLNFLIQRPKYFRMYIWFTYF